MRSSMSKNPTALITGASSGIGKACSEKLAASGYSLVLIARREDRITNLANELRSRYGVQCRPVAIDVTDEQRIAKLPESLKKEGFYVDTIINNAGLALSVDPLQNGNPSNWNTMIDTNIKGVLWITRAFLPDLVADNRGHIVNIGSVAGRGVYPGGNIYCMTKHAIKAFSESLRLDLAETEIRVSEIAPGAVETEFSEVRFSDPERAKAVYRGFSPLTPEDIAETVIFCLNRPPHVNISEIVVYPQAQAGLGSIRRNNRNEDQLFPPPK